MNPTTQTAPAELSNLVGSWKLEPVHSTLGFSVRHMGVATFRGAFTDFDGTLEAGSDGGLSVDGTVGASSIVTADSKLYGHLLSPEFFDAEEHPRLHLRASGELTDAEQLVLQGELEIRGRRRPVQLHGALSGPLADPYGSERLGLELSGTIDRTEYGLDWNAPLPGGGRVLANEVQLHAHLELVKE